MSLVFTFLYVTNQAKALTLDGTLNFYTNLAIEKGHKSDRLDKATYKDFTKEKHEDKNQ